MEGRSTSDLPSIAFQGVDMARPQTYEPIIVNLLRQHPEGMTRQELVELAGCSPQLVHKVIAKGRLPEGDRRRLPIQIVGKADHGRDVVAWVGNEEGTVADGGHARAWRTTPASRVRDAGKMVAATVATVTTIGLGEYLRVVAMDVDGGVTVERESGERVVLRQ